MSNAYTVRLHSNHNVNYVVSEVSAARQGAKSARSLAFSIGRSWMNRHDDLIEVVKGGRVVRSFLHPSQR